VRVECFIEPKPSAVKNELKGESYSNVSIQEDYVKCTHMGVRKVGYRGLLNWGREVMSCSRMGEA
jgi:hypothetical protein